MSDETFDPTSWQEQLDALLAQLPDDELAGELRADFSKKARAKLAAGDGPPLKLLSADEILNTDWPEPIWAVPGLLPVGLGILAGRPKLGKSWLALQIAQAVAAGGVALGQAVEAGPVLYLALEDTPRRLDERMRKQGWPIGLPADFMPLGQFFDQVGDLRNGGSELLARQIKHLRYRLVVIDTLSRAIIGDQNDMADMVFALTPLQEIAHEYNCAVVMIDHHRKGGGIDPDAIADILGSTAKGAMCDTAWGLYRERGRSGAKLAITGRDVDEQALALKMDWMTGCWQVEGDADALEMTDNRQELLGILAEIGPASLKEIVELTDRHKGPVYKDLQELINAGKATKTGKGRGTRYELLELVPVEN